MRFSLLAIAPLVVIVAASCGGPAVGPPAGLSPYGRVVWNLDALLHDTFGDREVWEDYGKDNIPDFSTEFLDLARSVPYTYTFTNAHDSSYRSERPMRPPAVATFVTGEDIPMRINAAYISCGHDLWLYEHGGQSLPGGDVFCAKSHRD